MPKFIAFLRAINVGGHNVKMDYLRTLFESAGFTNVETFIASGNVIFESKSKNVKALETKIETFLLKTLGYEVATFIRTDSELNKIAEYKPFSDSALQQAAALNTAFLKKPLDKDGVKVLMEFKTEIDDFHFNGKEIYWLCRVRQSDSTFSNTKFEKALKIKATFRSENTVRRLAAKYPVKDKI